MAVFESLNNTTDKAVDNGEKYIKSSKDYLKLKVFQQLAMTLSLATKFAIIGGLVGLALIFMATAGAMAIGDAINNIPLGFTIIGAVLLVFAVIGYLLKKHIDKKIIVTLSSKFFDK